MDTQRQKFYLGQKLLFSVVLSTLLFTFSVQTFAADFTVNLTTDQRDANLEDRVCDTELILPGEQCSLRAAVEQANSLGSNDRVFFNLPANSTITLTTDNGGEITMSNSGTLEIVGTGFARIRDGNGDGSAIVDIGAFERSNASDSRPTMFDFDGDGKADISVFRPSNGFWHIMKSSGGFSSIQWGQKTDELVPGDYDGDGKTDVAVYRGIADNYNWYIRRSSDTTLFARSWGIDQGYGGVTPVPGDYDGDGKTDLTVQILDDFVGAQPYFKILQSSTNTRTDRAWRIGISAPPADFDGDGKTDLTSIDNFGNSAFWTILQSTNGARRGVQFGLSTDKFVPADYDGDGKADIAIYRPSDGTWYRFNSSDDSFSAVRFGAAEDKPVPADYDGDGRTDIAVFRPSNGTWYLQQSKEGFAAGVFGFGDDIPIPNVYIR